MALTEKYFLGLDLSTQQLKCTVINDNHIIVYEDAVNFGRDLPEYHTNNGAISHGNDVVTSPPLMWVQAMDMLLSRLAKTPYVSNIMGISGAGQQHGSVYWAEKGTHVLKQLDFNKTLVEQLTDGGFAIEQSPIWQDSSTSVQCRQLEAFVGGPDILAQMTGSKAYERFTGNQIAKIHQYHQDQYKNTVWITLVSSFMTTLLLGKLGPMDAAEASGTNMMDIRKHRWLDQLLEFCGGKELRDKLGLQPIDIVHPLGPINTYYVQRYGFNSDCQIMPFTGDNSATLVSMNLRHGDCVVSLGTSDTVLVSLKKAETTTESHLMAHPTDSSAFMGMLCYKNGSLTRQHFRDIYAEHDWDTFNDLLTSTPSTSQYMGFYYWMQEIIPFAKGIYRFNNGELLDDDFTMDNNSKKSGINIRCLIESQFLSMRVRLERMMGGTTNQGQLQRILATGGASANHTILQVLSDVFGIPVYKKKEGSNGASFGGALLAKYGLLSDTISFDDMVHQDDDDGSLQLICEPNLLMTSDYSRRLDEYTRLENIVLEKYGL
ncbi:uncharacterized protein BX664DRAFT_288657 [Halteromyces radiatus]|uniref:uncharacterized protein n=1 Tax=Halteromyces radiatus TaxID=101107 RepID=UPI002221148E|nr:uncharacterized protein BX664DRAFT_288657 [Halteromyces radiatus]KAI8098885.1 hypothetical protein BX664DRAFT_288657 [Halteromyces radiatus]